MSLHRSLLVCVAIASALAGCNSSSSLRFDQIDNSIATKICDQLVRCPNPNTQAAQIAYIAAHPGTFSCADAFLRGGDFTLDSFQASIDAGRIRYDGAAAAACLSAIDGTCGSFDQVFGSNASCQNVFVGTVADGGTCYVDEDCAGDAYCDNGSGGCPGTCSSTATISQACDTAPCSDEYPGAVLRCTTTVANPNQHCVARTATSVGAGENCGVVSMTGDMEVEAFCQSGLYCKRSLAAPTGTCAVPVPLLQACVPNLDACVAGASCRPNGAGFRCEAFTVSNVAGTQCNDIDQLCNPLSRLECVTGSCALVGTGVADQPCRTSLATDCNAGLYCDDTGASPVCKAQLANGQPCDPGLSEACTSGYCDDVTNPSTPVCGINLCN